jgi:hypothetical protein
MGDCTFSDIGNDLHVSVRVSWKSRSRLNGVVVPHKKGSPFCALRVMIIRERKMMFSIQPPVVGATESAKRSEFDHCLKLRLILESGDVSNGNFADQWYNIALNNPEG